MKTQTLHSWRILGLTLVALLYTVVVLHADIYADWKARVFTTQEQADPNISGENADPAQDGVSNLLKFAFDLDPHQSTATGLPTVGTVLDYDYSNYPEVQIPFLSLTYRVPLNYYLDSSIYLVPEVSVDLVNWIRGENVISYPSYQYPQQPGDPYLAIVHALSPMNINQKMFMHLLVLDGRVLPLNYQMQIWGTTGIDPEGDDDLDGIKNFDEYLAGSDPKDYYNGQLPYLLQVASGGNQVGTQGALLPVPLAVRVESYGRQNAPLTFTVLQGGALLSATNAGTAAATATIDLRATTPYPDAYGYTTYAAQVYVHLPSTVNTDSVIQVTATTAGQSISITTTESTSDPNLQPPTDFTATATAPTSADLTWTPSDSTLPTTAEISMDGGATWKLAKTFAPGISAATLGKLTTGQANQIRLYTGGTYNPDTDSTNLAGANTNSVASPSSGGGGGGRSTPTPPASVTPLSEYGGQAQLFSEQADYNGTRYNFEGFQPDPQHPNPPTRYLTKKVVDSSTETVPDGDGGTTTTITHTDKKTGTETSDTITDSYGGQDYGGDEQITSDSSKKKHGVDSDGSGETSDVTTTLMDLYDADTFVSDVEGWVPAFTGNLGYAGSGAYAYIHLSLPDKLTYRIIKLQYKWKANNDPSVCALWDVRYEPEDTTATITDTFQRWSPGGTPNAQGQAESSIYTIDPTTLNDKKNGTYTVYPADAQLDSYASNNGPQDFAKETPRDPNRARPSITDLEPDSITDWIRKLDSLVIFYDQVHDTSSASYPGYAVSDFEVDLVSKLQFDGVKWTKTLGPTTGDFEGRDSYQATFSNPKKGGLWKFDSNLLDKAHVGTQLLLPLAGAELYPWLTSEFGTIGTWTANTKAAIEAAYATNNPTLSKIPGFSSHNDYSAFCHISGAEFDYTLDPVNSDGTAPCIAFKPTGLYSYVTVNSVVIHGSKINNMLWCIFSRYWGYNTDFIKLGAEVNEIYKRYQLDNDSSQAAIDLGGEVADLLMFGTPDLIDNLFTPSALVNLHSDELIDTLLWPCTDTYDPGKSTLVKPTFTETSP